MKGQSAAVEAHNITLAALNMQRAEEAELAELGRGETLGLSRSNNKQADGAALFSTQEIREADVNDLLNDLEAENEADNGLDRAPDPYKPQPMAKLDDMIAK